jgi:hypothetical protein
MPSRITSSHQRQPPTWKLRAASLRSLGKALAPAMTLKRMYHWVPRIISGLSHTFGWRWKWKMATTATGKRMLAGNAARNWASG